MNDIAKLLKFCRDAGRPADNAGWVCTEGGAKYFVTSDGNVEGFSTGTGSRCEWHDARSSSSQAVLNEVKAHCRRVIRDQLVDSELEKILSR